MTSLADKLTPHEMDQVHAVPVRVGPGDRWFAASLRSRLGARLLLHGRIEGDAHDYAVFARVVERVDRTGTHFDLHTKDKTPIKRSPADLVERLTPSKNATSEEYPFEFATELEAVVRGTAGQLALALDDQRRAQRLLDEAISVAPHSTSHQVDRLRVDLAVAHLAAEDEDGALQILRDRAAGEDPSPRLLDFLHTALFFISLNAPEEEAIEMREEAIAALRKGLAARADPQRDQRVYNLAMDLANHPDESCRSEGAEMLEELTRTSAFYNRAWYVHRSLGGIAWHQGQTQKARAEAEAVASFRRAARAYSKAIRLRPKFQLFSLVDGERLIWTRYPRSALLHANAEEAHFEAGNRLRGRWHRLRANRARSRFLRRGKRFFKQGNWRRAFANFDWAITGRGDFIDMYSHTYVAAALKQLGDDEGAENSWSAAKAISDFALVTRAAMIFYPEDHPIERGLPGNEDTDLIAICNRLGIPVPAP